MTERFGQTAVKLSQGPLGIIALFIVLIHGFASLVLGLASDIGDFNRSVLIWFLVLFPSGVFLAFVWLVSRKHETLYPPQAFRDQGHFLQLAELRYGRTGYDKQFSLSGDRKKPEPAGRTLNREALGNLYWLGHDLMWTADTLLRQGPVEHVLIGMDQALHHLARVGLGKTAIERQLQSLHGAVEASGELSPALRGEYAAQIGSIIDQIGATAELIQGEFQVPPHWQRVRS